MREIDMWSTSAHGYKCRMGAGTTSNTREGRTVAVTGDMVGVGEGEHKGTETEGKGKMEEGKARSSRSRSGHTPWPPASSTSSRRG